MTQVWKLEDRRQTMVLASVDGRMPSVVYWGGKLPQGEDLAVLAQATCLDVTGGMLDRLPDLSICPEVSQRDAIYCGGSLFKT